MIHGEITYNTVHSDLISPEITDEFRALLHGCLDEWLDKADGNGAFWVGDPEYFAKWGQ